MEMLLRDPRVEPTDDILARALGKSFAAYKAMREIVTNPPYGLELSRRYYNDGKAWLYKASFKKKTVFWMSVWPGFLKFRFTLQERIGRGFWRWISLKASRISLSEAIARRNSFP